MELEHKIEIQRIYNLIKFGKHDFIRTNNQAKL